MLLADPGLNLDIYPQMFKFLLLDQQTCLFEAVSKSNKILFGVFFFFFKVERMNIKVHILLQFSLSINNKHKTSIIYQNTSKI